MNGALRHTACKSCRDRKVRCGGEQPSCSKCLRAGENCVYLPTQRPTRADLTQTVEALQKRLYETESRISRMASKEHGSTAAALSPPFYAAPWSTGAKFSGPAAVFHCPLPPFTSPGADVDPPTSSSQAGYPSLSYQPHNPSSPGSLNTDFLDSLQPTGSPRSTMERNGSMHLGREEDGRNHYTNSDVDISGTLAFSSFATETHHPQHGQGFADVTGPAPTNGSSGGSSSSVTLHDAAAAVAVTTTATTASSAGAVVPPRGSEASGSISAPIATILADFSAAVFHSQAEIAGMSSAVADYIAWMRKVPTGIAPPNTSLVYVNVLEAVEARLREMGDIAQTRPRAAFRDMVAALQAVGDPVGVGAAVCDRLAPLEKDFDRQAADVAEFFRTRYNACAALSEQARNIPHGHHDQVRRGSSEGEGSSQ